MQTYYCREGCCQVKIKTYNSKKRCFNRNYRKAGVFIYDPEEEKVLSGEIADQFHKRIQDYTLRIDSLVTKDGHIDLGAVLDPLMFSPTRLYQVGENISSCKWIN